MKVPFHTVVAVFFGICWQEYPEISAMLLDEAWVDKAVPKLA